MKQMISIHKTRNVIRIIKNIIVKKEKGKQSLKEMTKRQYIDKNKIL